MCVTIGGKIGACVSGAEIVPPRLTEAITPSMASSTTTLPPVLPVISSACSSGNAGPGQRGERPRPACDRDLLDDRADLHRHAQPEAVPLRAPPTAFLPLQERDDSPGKCSEDQPPVAGHRMGEGDRDLGDRGEFAPELFEDTSNTGTRNATSAIITPTANTITRIG